MDEDMFETLDGDFRVEVTVSCGRTHGVSLSALVEIPKDNRVKGRLKLREMVDFLRSVLPVNELKSDEREFHKPPEGAALTKTGEIVPAPVDQVDVNRKVMETRTRLNVNDKGADPKT